MCTLAGEAPPLLPEQAHVLQSLLPIFEAHNPPAQLQRLRVRPPTLVAGSCQVGPPPGWEGGGAGHGEAVEGAEGLKEACTFVTLRGGMAEGVRVSLAPAGVDAALLQHCSGSGVGRGGGTPQAAVAASNPTATVWLKCANPTEEAVLERRLGVSRVAMRAFVDAHVVGPAQRGLLPTRQLDEFVVALVLRCAAAAAAKTGQAARAVGVVGDDEQEAAALVQAMRCGCGRSGGAGGRACAGSLLTC